MEVSGVTGSMHCQLCNATKRLNAMYMPFRNVRRQSTMFAAIDNLRRLSADASTTLKSVNAAIRTFTPREMKR